MAGPPNQVLFPSTFQELFSAWSRFPSAVPYAGGTGIIRGQGGQILDLPPVILSLDKLVDLQRITRTERYLEIGAMVKLSQVIWLGKIVPEALNHCLENIAGAQLRNIATIGGNICYPAARLDTSAVLTALDAQYELRSAQSSRWISASRFSALPGPTALNPLELLTRILVPLDQWDYSVYKKFSAGIVVFLIKTQKDALTDMRVVYKTETILRDKNSEAILIGKQLPLSHRDAAEFVENWEIFLSGIQNLGELSKRELLNFIESNVYNLTE
ncbi:MAG: FAD binding domain-containing protein [Treponema sp.]|jgi:CO/xanthine dehydrogenase FAD-binding subunit|nr:FAD binding domain-containing protein [Treponema sp.]